MLKKNSFTIFVYLTILLLFALGSWQLHRLAWKKDLISKISNSFQSPPIQIPINLKAFEKIKFSGTIIGNPISVYNLGEKGVYGFDIYYPLLVENKSLMIKAGWSPIVIKESKNFIGKKFEFEGVVLNYKKRNIFTPDNSEKNFYYFINSKILTEKYNKRFDNFYLHETSNIFKSLNLIKSHNINIRNNHLQYALTWYCLCFIIIIAFINYRKKNEIY